MTGLPAGIIITLAGLIALASIIARDIRDRAEYTAWSALVLLCIGVIVIAGIVG